MTKTKMTLKEAEAKGWAFGFDTHRKQDHSTGWWGVSKKTWFAVRASDGKRVSHPGMCLRKQVLREINFIERTGK